MGQFNTKRSESKDAELGVRRSDGSSSSTSSFAEGSTRKRGLRSKIRSKLGFRKKRRPIVEETRRSEGSSRDDDTVESRSRHSSGTDSSSGSDVDIDQFNQRFDELFDSCFPPPGPEPVIDWSKVAMGTATLEQVLTAKTLEEFNICVKKVKTPAAVFQERYGVEMSPRIRRDMSGPVIAEEILPSDYEVPDAERMNVVPDGYVPDPDEWKPPIATLDDYKSARKLARHVDDDAFTVFTYPIVRKMTMPDGAVHLECFGPSVDTTEDFWTELHDRRASLIVMFGGFDVAGHLVNCARYMPNVDEKTWQCGRLIVKRLLEPQTRGRCRFQMLGVRCSEVSENDGMYLVWHCERAIQSAETSVDQIAIEDAEFNRLKLELLETMTNDVVVIHGPQADSPLQTPFQLRMLGEQQNQSQYEEDVV